MLATTATANARVSGDVAEQLGGEDAGAARARSTASRSASASSGCPTPEQRLAWLADHLAEQPGSGIVYCLTVAATQQVADYLRARGHDVAAYSGQTEPTERLELEDALATGRIKALVATSALGMGFDATLGFVVNLGAPQSPVAYYQQVGRAGRGTDSASVVLIPQQEDKDIWALLRLARVPARGPGAPHAAGARLRRASPASARSRRWSTSAAAASSRCSRCSTSTAPYAGSRAAGRRPGRTWSYDADRYERVSQARKREQAAMLDYLDTDRCRMWFLRDQLDDPDVEETTRCGRCDTCGGMELSTSVTDGAVDEARTRLARPGVVVEPRAMWPTALTNLGLDLRGRIGDAAAPGRAVARLTDLGHGQALRDLFAEPTTDQPVPERLVHAVIEVLQRLAAPRRRIVVVESATRPTLTADLADGLSRFLKKPVVGRWAIADPTVAARSGRHELRATGGRGDPALPARRRRSRPVRCCSSTTRSSPGGR